RRSTKPNRYPAATCAAPGRRPRSLLRQLQHHPASSRARARPRPSRARNRPYDWFVGVDMNRRHPKHSLLDRPISRRTFMKLVGVSAVAAAAGPTLLRAQNQSGTLRILQWSHFVPSYDTWFDRYAQQWGAANGVNVV